MPRSAPHHPARPAAPSAARLTRTGRKRRLLTQALRVFAERGYHNTTPEVVADLAGVPEELLAKHFPDKASLFRAVLDEVRAATLDHWRSEAAALPDPLARLHAVAESYLGAARADAAEVRLLFRALADCDDKEVAGSLQAFFEECESFLAGILIEGQQAGVFRRAADARVGARQLVQTGLGHVALRQLGTEPPDEIDSLAREVECLLHGLLKTDV